MGERVACAVSSDADLGRKRVMGSSRLTGPAFTILARVIPVRTLVIEPISNNVWPFGGAALV